MSRYSDLAVRWTVRGSNPVKVCFLIRMSGLFFVPTQRTIQWVPAFFRGDKEAGA